MSHATLDSMVFVLQSAMPVLLLLAILTLGILIFRFNRANRRGHALRFLVAMALLGGCGLALTWAVPQEYVARREIQRAERYAKNSHVNIGDRVPSFAIPDTEGIPFSTDELRGKVLVINLFATWCGPCKLELPHLEEIDREFRDREEFELIVIGRGETDGQLCEFRDQQSLTVRMAADPEETVFNMFADEMIPRTIVVSPAGKIVYTKAGFYERDVALIRKTIRQSL